MEKEYDKGVVGDNQLEMTRFQKQVLLAYEAKKKEKEQEKMGSSSPSGALNARHGGDGRSETVRYVNTGEETTDNMATFVDS